MSSRLSTARDTTLIAGTLALIAGIAYAVLDDLGTFPRPNISETMRQRDERAGRATMAGDHGDLYQVTADTISGNERSCYLRPATEAEEAASRQAGDFFGVGSEVFAVNTAGDFVFPDDPEWSAVLAEKPYSETARLSYFRVS